MSKKNTTNKKKNIRGPGFSKLEMMSLASLVERIMAITTNEWEQVAKEHSKVFPGKRSEYSLQRKFKKICNTRPRTGNTEGCEVHRRFMEVQEKILDDLLLSDGEDE